MLFHDKFRNFAHDAVTHSFSPRALCFFSACILFCIFVPQPSLKPFSQSNRPFSKVHAVFALSLRFRAYPQPFLMRCGGYVRSSSFFCAKQKVLRRVRKVNKFHQSRPVSACRQKLLPYRVRYQCRNTLPQYPVIVKYRQCSIISLSRQFMLAARHRKNVLCTSLHCIIQCIIRCCVACVKRYHHIDCLIRSAVRYISRLKMQI